MLFFFTDSICGLVLATAIYTSTYHHYLRILSHCERHIQRFSRRLLGLISNGSTPRMGLTYL